LDPTTGAEMWSFARIGSPLMTIAEDHIWQWGWSGDNRVLRRIVP